MPPHLGLSIHFLDPTFHGRGDGGDPEWPPSPLRVFQALVAAAARREGLGDARARSALEWLERRGAPTILAPAGVTASGHRLSVPNNAMDVVARAWCRGNESNTGDANPAKHRTMKRVRPTWLLDGDTVHYLWPLADPPAAEVRDHVDALWRIAGSVAALGWGTDLAVGHGAVLGPEEADALPGERWVPAGGQGRSVTSVPDLRVPVAGTLDDLVDRHSRFLARLDGGTLTAVAPSSVHATVTYRRATDPVPRPFAAFSLLRLDAGGFRAFDAQRRALTVAGMARHGVRLAAERAGWSADRVEAFVLGHGGSGSAGDHGAGGARRFAYMPLPSIEARGGGPARVVGDVRRLLVSSFAGGCEVEIAWARRALAGQELIDERTGQPVALLSLLPATDRVVGRYTRTATSWATVTPVVLPGYDDPAHCRRRLERRTSAKDQRLLLDRLARRIEGLLRKAIVQAGFSRALADHAELEWRKTGFLPGVDRVDRYGVPRHLGRFPRFHVSLRWRDERGRPLEVPGPICIGGGRFYGLGLFTALPAKSR